MAEQTYKIAPEKITEISLKCSGYGYFQADNARNQTHMKQHFLTYLKDAISTCSSVRTIKIEYNGFSNDTRELNQILSLISKFVNLKENRPMEKGKARFDAIWIHTRHIKNVTKTEVEKMLDLTAELAKGSV